MSPAAFAAGCIQAGRRQLQPTTARAAAAQEAATDEEGFTLTFRTPSGGEEEVVATWRPFGIGYELDQTPIVVTKVEQDCGAAWVGVQPGWTLIKAGGESLEGLTYKETIEALERGILPLPNREEALQAAFLRGDFRTGLRYVGVPPAVLPALLLAVEAFILFGNVAIVYLITRLLPAEWLAGLPEPLRGLFLPAEGG